MHTITMNANDMTSREQAHALFKAALNFPEWYGANLDALYDLLTELSSPVCLTLIHPQAAVEQLGEYGAMLLRTLEDAAAENPSFKLVIKQEY